MPGDHDLRQAPSLEQGTDDGADVDAAIPVGLAPQRDLSGREAVERDRAVMALLRQLSSGLSAYRLFPGDLKQPTFVQVVQRIRDAAQAALAWGPFDAEINGNRFFTSTGPVASDERVERLALALYEHGTERLWVRGLPDARELGVLYEALARPAHAEGEGGGSVGSALRVAGVKSIAVREVMPQGTERDEVRGGPTAEQRAVWAQLGDPDKVAAELAEAGGSGSVAEAARTVFARFQDVVAHLPERVVKGFQLYARLHEVMARLPAPLRKQLIAYLLERITEDELAERMIGTLTDAELARILVEQGEDGTSDPLELARRLVSRGIRRDDVIDLTVALMSGREEGGTIMPGLEGIGLSHGPMEEASPVARTVSNLLARGLVSAGQEDVRSIRQVFPQTAEQRREIAHDALFDYLRVETDPDRLGEVLGVWAEETIRAIRRRDEESVAELLRVVSPARDGEAPTDKRTVAEASVKRALAPEIIAELVVVGEEAADPRQVLRLLLLFGDDAVDCLMEDLAQERDRGRRALLLSVLSQVARGRQHRLTKWLADPRWFVARNAVTALYRSGGEEAIPLLFEAARHAEPSVRREAARGLVELVGLDALPDLMSLAGDTDVSVRGAVIAALGAVVKPGASETLAKLAFGLKDAADKRRALDALAGHPAPEAATVLENLASSRVRPRLPRRLRRYAKALAKKRAERSP